MPPIVLLAGLYLAWGIGANDSAKVFAPAVATGSIGYRKAVTLIAIFVVLGAATQGHLLYEDYHFGNGAGSATLLREATIATFSAAFAVMVMTILGVPISTSQAGVGAMVGVAGARLGPAGLDLGLLRKMLLCWLATPPAGGILSYLLYRLLARPLGHFLPSVGARSRFLSGGLVMFGCYEAYALGANNVVVTTGPFYQAGLFGPPGEAAVRARFLAATIGSLAIALGALTFAGRVMETFGRKVTVLDPYSAWIVAVATGVTMQAFTFLHVPVSITQAGIGALVGVGLTKGSGGISLPTLRRICLAWVLSPLTAGLMAWALAKILVP